jgi:hypothetical protein
MTIFRENEKQQKNEVKTAEGMHRQSKKSLFMKNRSQHGPLKDSTKKYIKCLNVSNVKYLVQMAFY